MSQKPYLLSLGKPSSSRYVRYYKLGVPPLLPNQLPEVQSKLRIDVLRLRPEQVVIQRASLHYALAGLHGHVDPEVLAQRFREQVPFLHVGPLGHYRLLHRKAALVTLVVRFLVVQAAFLAFVRLGRGVCAEHELLSHGKGH